MILTFYCPGGYYLSCLLWSNEIKKQNRVINPNTLQYQIATLKVSNKTNNCNNIVSWLKDSDNMVSGALWGIPPLLTTQQSLNCEEHK